MAEYEDSAAMDALLAALTDEPLPEGARDDAEFLAEHRSAVTDVALLREQLRMMGDALAAGTANGRTPAAWTPDARTPDARTPDARTPDARTPDARASAGQTPAAQDEWPGPESSPASAPPRHSNPLRPSEPRGKPKSLRAPKPVGPPQPPWYRRYAGVALGTLVVAAGTAMLGGLVWLGARGAVDDADSGAADSSAAKQESGAGDASLSTSEMHLACSKVLVEGTVQSITSADDGNVSVVLKVKRYYRPERSVTDHPTITVTLLASAREDLKVGTYTLVRVPVYPEDRQDWETGGGVADARRGILEALPGARGMECAGPDGGAG